MLSRIGSVAVHGIEAYAVEIEVNIGAGLPGVVMVGLPDPVVKESRERIKPAASNSGFRFPYEKITINLAPADRRKEGAAFDLPVTLGVLAASEQLAPQAMAGRAFVGELALEGTVRPVRGVLSMALECRRAGLDELVLPRENAAEAAVVDGLKVIPVSSLRETVEYLAGRRPIAPARVDVNDIFSQQLKADVDFAEVRGQHHVKRALTVAAAGGHNVLMLGPPGSGKTMLARRLATVLPLLTRAESLATTRIHSVARLLGREGSLIAVRPFRAPHHTVSDIGLIGGGGHPRPGEVSLAHNGVLFLDELPEFNRKTLEVLRQPLEDGEVTITRASATVTYPARIMLIAAMNPCPCGYATDPQRECACLPTQIQKYLGRVSGPLLDRIDIHVEVPAVPYRDLAGQADGLSSETMRRRVSAARERQRARLGAEGETNAKMGNRQLKKHCRLGAEAEALLKQAMDSLGLSARAYTKILKIARTIADLESSEGIEPGHLTEAIQYRTLDRKNWLV